MTDAADGVLIFFFNFSKKTSVGSSFEVSARPTKGLKSYFM